MGMECPNNHGRQRVAVNITSDGSNPVKASQVVAWKLTCGCVVGGEDYEKFREESSRIERIRADTIRTAEEIARKAKATAYRTFVVETGGQKHAE